MRENRILFALLALLATGLIAAGCGDDDGDGNGGNGSDGGSIQDLTTPEGVEEALENVPETVDEAVDLCKDAVDASGLSGDAKDDAIKQCEQGGQQAQDAIEEDLGGP